MLLWDKIREQRERKTTRDARCTPLYLVGALPGGHTRRSSGIPCLRGTDVGLQSLLSGADKCPCGACCVRVSRYSFAPEYSTKATPNFFAAKVENFSGEKTHSLSRKQPNHYFFEKRHISILKPSFNLEFLCRVVMKQKYTPTASHKKKHTHTHLFTHVLMTRRQRRRRETL